MNEGLGRTILLCLLWLLLYFVPPVVGSIVGDVFLNRMDYSIMSWSMLLGSMLIVVVFLGKRHVKLSWGRIEKRRVWPVVGISVVIAVVNLLCLMSLYELIDFDHLFQNATEHMTENAQNLSSSGIVGILYGCLFAPIAEEIGFRGLFLGGLLKTRCRPWLAIIISALVFALFHGIGSFIGAMLFGIIVGWLYCRTGSMVPGIIAHIVNNSLSFIDLSCQSHATVLVIFVGSLLLLALSLCWFGKMFDSVSESEIHTR